MTTEDISTSATDAEWWICQCGNTPGADGFYPCDREGRPVEPTPEDWQTGWYVCDRCGRIIDQTTRAIVGLCQR